MVVAHSCSPDIFVVIDVLLYVRSKEQDSGRGTQDQVIFRGREKVGASFLSACLDL